MPPATLTSRFLDAGEAALVVEFGATVDPVTHDHVIALDEALRTLAISGVLETVPTFRSLMIHYDPLILDRASLVAKISGLQPRLDSPATPKNSWTVPCCYEAPFGEDLTEVARAMNMPAGDVVALHSGATFRAYMYGFAPGFCYLGGLPEKLAISRRPMPRAPHPQNAVLIAGGLSLIGTFSMPTGWWVIGRTPVRLFSPSRSPNFLIEVGDSVRFAPIDKNEFQFLEEKAVAGHSVAGCEKLR